MTPQNPRFARLRILVRRARTSASKGPPLPSLTSASRRYIALRERRKPIRPRPAWPGCRKRPARIDFAAACGHIWSELARLRWRGDETNRTVQYLNSSWQYHRMIRITSFNQPQKARYAQSRTRTLTLTRVERHGKWADRFGDCRHQVRNPVEPNRTEAVQTCQV